MNNYLCEYTGITLKVLTTINQHGILWERKETVYDRYGRDAYGQRRCSYPQIHTLLYQGIVQKRRVKGCQDRWALEDQARGVTRLRRQTSTRQNIKATRRWQLKILVADDPIPKVSHAAGKRSSIATGPWLNLIMTGRKIPVNPSPCGNYAMNVPVASQESVHG